MKIDRLYLGAGIVLVLLLVLGSALLMEEKERTENEVQVQCGFFFMTVDTSIHGEHTTIYISNGENTKKIHCHNGQWYTEN